MVWADPDADAADTERDKTHVADAGAADTERDKSHVAGAGAADTAVGY